MTVYGAYPPDLLYVSSYVVFKADRAVELHSLVRPRGLVVARKFGICGIYKESVRVIFVVVGMLLPFLPAHEAVVARMCRLGVGVIQPFDILVASV